jgi:hypothetical protein
VDLQQRRGVGQVCLFVAHEVRMGDRESSARKRRRRLAEGKQRVGCAVRALCDLVLVG